MNQGPDEPPLETQSMCMHKALDIPFLGSNLLRYEVHQQNIEHKNTDIVVRFQIDDDAPVITTFSRKKSPLILEASIGVSRTCTSYPNFSKG
tara:strand:- start:199 stop:474 length:276 start_codon:yes stop_codon:yes gene_type:complete